VKTVSIINYLIAAIFFVCYSYQLLYLVISIIRKAKPPVNSALHNFAVLIAARNEEAVIGNLIESIKMQTYPSHLIKIFVVADNCTDNTAAIAKAAGAEVWERFNKHQIGKGYAIDFLLEKINEVYPKNTFDGYFIFDADNLLDENFITEMNKVFSDKNRVVTSYRNSKNYGSNWISAGFSLWFLRESQYLNRPRMILGTSCAVTGTGFLFHRDIIEKTNGWKYYMLTEDIEFTVRNVLDGEKVAYCESAILYDEQPVDFNQSIAQRMRWSKGSFQVFKKYGAELLASIFTSKKNSFACFDMAMSTMPGVVLSALGGLINICAVSYSLIKGDNIRELIYFLLVSAANLYLMFYPIGLITTITEWKRIYCNTAKKILYTFTFPFFMLIHIPISIAVIFAKVEWKQIRHTQSKTLDEVRNMAG